MIPIPETNMTEEKFLERLYMTVTGAIVPGLAIPEAKNLFASDQPCDRLYNQVQTTCQRICQRLSPKAEDDRDLTEVLNLMDHICQLVGYEMYRCGVHFSSQHPK